MDYFSEDLSHATDRFAPHETNLEDRLTFKRWARTLGSFYACVFLVMGIVIAAHQIGTSTGLQQQASLRTGQAHR